MELSQLVYNINTGHAYFLPKSSKIESDGWTRYESMPTSSGDSEARQISSSGLETGLTLRRLFLLEFASTKRKALGGAFGLSLPLLLS